MASSAVSGVCAFVYRDSVPVRVVFDTAANPQLAASVSDLELHSYCVDENKPISTVLAFNDSELIVMGVLHGAHTVIVAWHTNMFMDMLSIVQGRRYDGPDALRNNLSAGIPTYNPKARGTRQLHPYVNYPYIPLVRAFGYEGLRMLMSLASAGSSIIFVGDTFSAPSLCCFGLRASLQPLEWLGLFAPVCDPMNVVATMGDGPAMVGTHSSAIPSLLLSNRKRTFIANCHTGVVAPTGLSTMVYVFPPSEKLKTALGDGSDISEGVYNYWATHCIGQYRKGLNGRAFDPFKCLFPTTAGSSRENLARNLSSGPSFGRWLTEMVKDDSRSTFTDFCARCYPDLYPEQHKSKGGMLSGLALFAKAKQTIRSMTTDVDVALSQYMTNSDCFGGHHSSGGEGFGGGNAQHGARLPLDCLINFDAYHVLLQPRGKASSSICPDANAINTNPASPTRKTGMSMKRDAPPKVMSIVEAPNTKPTNAVVTSATMGHIPPAPTNSGREQADEPVQHRVISPNVPPPTAMDTETHRAVLDLSGLRNPTPPPQVLPTPAQQHAPMPSPNPPSQQQEAPAGKYDAFAELEKIAINPTSATEPEKPAAKKTYKLDDFF